MSAKSKLQEIYQKKQQELPAYSAVNLSGIPSDPAWKAQVVTVDGIKVWSRQFNKKTQAENDAAEKCLMIIARRTESRKANPYRQPEYPKAIIFIDLENVPLGARTRITTPDNDIRIIGFVGKYNRGILKDREKIENMMELVIVDCTGADAADHAITFYAGDVSSTYTMICARENKPKTVIKWFILSSDQFAAVPIEFLRKAGYPDSHSVTHLGDLKKMLPDICLTPA